MLLAVEHSSDEELEDCCSAALFSGGEEAEFSEVTLIGDVGVLSSPVICARLS